MPKKKTSTAGSGTKLGGQPKGPPKATQFKPGQSGNPKGRPKQPPSLDALARKYAHRPVTISIAGQTITLSSAEWAMKSLTLKAAHGDLKATKLFVEIMERAEASAAFSDPELKGMANGMLTKLTMDTGIASTSELAKMLRFLRAGLQDSANEDSEEDEGEDDDG